MSDTYLTIQDKSEGIYTEKRSKFLAFAHPVETIDEIKDLLTDYKKKYTTQGTFVMPICWDLKGQISG